MRSIRKNPKRILSIDPCPRGFGFVIMEGSDRLIDWGVKDVHCRKNFQSLKAIQSLIDRYDPDLVVVEDSDARGSRRWTRTRNLGQEIAKLCSANHVRIRLMPRLSVRKVFGASTKDQIAATIIQRFPELATWQPRPRKAKHAFTEDSRMSIFDAVALAQTLSP